MLSQAARLPNSILKGAVNSQKIRLESLENILDSLPIMDIGEALVVVGGAVLLPVRSGINDLLK